MKKKSRVYILPTRMGGYLIGLIFLMFLLAVGYNNNLLLIFTLFLFALNLMWVIQTHFHLYALKVNSVVIEDGHAGENVLARINWKKTPEEPHVWKIRIENEVHQLKVVSLESNKTFSTCQVILPNRGLWKFEHLYVKTEMPFGLYQVWVYLPIQTEVYAYPQKLKDVPAPTVVTSEIEGEHSTQIKGTHDVWNLAPYDHSESRKISWKHYARSGELVIKEGEELKMSEVHFQVKENISNKEKFLSTLAGQMVHCQNNETAFSLKAPGFCLGPASGEKHLNDCLRILAIC